MADQNQKQDADVIIRTMKTDLEKITAGPIKSEEKPSAPGPLRPISQEARMPQAAIPMPSYRSTPPTPSVPITPVKPAAPPVLIIPPKVIPPKVIPQIPARPLYKTMPTWIKLGAIGFGVILITLAGLYGYWKIFIQTKPPEIPPAVIPPATTTPGFPVVPPSATTTPLKFFNKLPNKTITIDLPSKTSDALMKALKSEAAVSENRALIKQIKLTYLGKPLTIQEFFDLMAIFSPKDFLLNYENEFVLAFFIQKEGARPILILRSKNRDLMRAQMDDWEKTTLASDIFPIFLSNFKLPAALSAFRSYLFINQPVRYLNVNAPFASLNYAIYNDVLIFTTSSAGMFVVLQDLTGQSVSQNYLENLKASIGEFVK